MIWSDFSSWNGFVWSCGVWASVLTLSLQVRRAGPSFSSKDQLLAWVASLPTGPKWRSTTLEMTGYPTIQPINLIWRDGLEVVQDLFANPIFANHMTYDPHVVVDGGEREYSEYFTAQQAYEIQVSLMYHSQ